MRFLDFDSIGKGNRFVKPAVGDAINYEGRKYIVTEVGLKYLHIQNPANGALGLVKVTEITKWLDAEPETKQKPLSNLSEFAEYEN